MVLLSGGRTEIMKVGQSVIRPLKPWTKSVHGYLSFLNKEGFDLVPKPIAHDVNDVVTFIEGQVHNGLLPESLKSDATLVEVASILRRLHDLGAEYLKTLTGDEIWMLQPVRPFETMCHGDFAPYNTVCDSDRIQGIIDFDTLHPGPRLWDLAYTAYRWVPLMSEDNPEDFMPDRRMKRLQLFLESYGMAYSCDELLDWAIKRLEGLMDYMEKAAQDHPEVAEAIAQGHLETYRSDLKAISKMRKAMI